MRATLVPGAVAMAAAATTVATMSGARLTAATMSAAAMAPVAQPAGEEGCAPDRATLTRARFLMGAPLTVEARGRDVEGAIEAAFVEVARLESILSNWRPDSEVSRVNREAARHPLVVSEDFYAALSSALRWAEATDGRFDPTVEPLVRRFGLRGPEGRLPGTGEPPASDTPTGPVGWRAMRLDSVHRTIAFDAEGMGIDFGGIGKGIALDAAAAVLRRAGVESAMLDFAGQVLVIGAAPLPDGWTIGIADPDDRLAAAFAVRLERGSLATSGNSERPVVSSGRTVGHILDPRTGQPVAWNGSVTVLAEDATAADALSTALFVLGPKQGVAWAAERGIQVLFLERNAQGRLIRHSTGALFTGATSLAPPAGSEDGGRPATPTDPAITTRSR